MGIQSVKLKSVFSTLVLLKCQVPTVKQVWAKNLNSGLKGQSCRLAALSMMQNVSFVLLDLSAKGESWFRISAVSFRPLYEFLKKNSMSTLSLSSKKSLTQDCSFENGVSSLDYQGYSGSNSLLEVMLFNSCNCDPYRLSCQRFKFEGCFVIFFKLY